MLFRSPWIPKEVPQTDSGQTNTEITTKTTAESTQKNTTEIGNGYRDNPILSYQAAKIWKNKSENKIDEESFKVRQLVMRIIAEMEILLEMEFFENAVLIDGLCNHMKPAINRMKQGVFTENQYIDFLEQKYSKVYVATIKACEFLKEELHIKKLPEGEMGFIALYFCVAVEQQKDKEEKLSV